MGIPILSGSRDLLSGYDVIISDVWGVVHDGLRAHTAACHALERARANGTTVILLSNAPGTNGMVAPVLDEKGVTRAAWDALVTSGDITRARLVETGLSRVFHIGQPRDMGLFDGLDITLVDEADANIIVATELRDDRRETPEDYRPLLTRMAARNLPFLCGNPDFVVHVGDDLLPCAGALAAIYAGLGGEVHWAGKPHRPAFAAALAAAERIRGGSAAKARVLMIGDTLRTDLAGARDFGIDGFFVVSGVHRDETMPGGVIDEARVSELCAAAGVVPVAAMSELVW
jgi:HAD superfamily hydrolase (TIGR01459 family)